ncbi:hypothetical protein [Amycolatopsis sp. NPDC051903]|uniref:hypothetical protein n=1 Tax=Amycolatopsis sp. NPDC051903 TaxID=3363936 RepID=UPI00378D2C4D
MNGARIGPAEVLAVAGGLVSGGFAAFAYYTDGLRILAHAFVLWIVLVVAVSSRASPGRAYWRTVAALVPAVLAFYFGKKIAYGVKYSGMPYLLDTGTVVLWCVLGFAAGLLGLVFRHIGTDTRAGVFATAAAVGLLLADAVREGGRQDPVTLTVATVLGIGVVLWLGVGSLRKLGLVVALAVPCAVVSTLLVALPDVFEALL